MSNDKALKTLAIVTARGGSKGIPRKNIVDLGGKPLISYCLEAIKKSKTVDRLIVTTDDKEIAKVAIKYGAEVPFMRPAELAQDKTPNILAIIHALEWFEDNEGYRPDYVLLVHPTGPFIRAEQIDKVFKLIIEKRVDSGITMVEVPRNFHPYHVRIIDKDGYLQFEQPRLHYAHPNRQSDPKRYAFGNLYWFKRDFYLDKKALEVGRRVGMIIDQISAFDINTPDDLKIAKILIKKIKRS